MSSVPSLKYHDRYENIDLVCTYNILAIKRTPDFGVWSARHSGLNVGGVRIPHPHPHPHKKMFVLDTLFSE